MDEIAEQSENGCASDVVDAEESRILGNQRLLDPHATPENLRTFAFGVGCPCPTRRMTRETAIALRSLVYPMFGNPAHYSPDGLEVGEARNQIVEQALRDGVKWLFFLDYDVAPPANALVKLLSHKRPITAGVYFLKQVPSYPLIWIKGWDYAYEDWDIGDLVLADGVGMGCTLIDTDVFRKIKAPWFKTVPNYSPKTAGLLPGMTEDIYFCEKARAAGYEILVDTSIQALHVDADTGLMYGAVPSPNNPGKWTAGWTYRKGDEYISETLADANHPGASWNVPQKPKVNKDLWLDLGSGGQQIDGYTGVDLFTTTPGTLKGSIEDLKWIRDDHGLAKKIRASHSLEHMSHQEIPRIFRDWVNTLSPGGEIEVRVPDGEYHMRAIIDRIDSEEDVDPQCDWLNATIYGLQIGPGQEHKSLFTMRRLEQLGKSSGLVNVKVERVEHEGNGATMPTTAELVLTGKRGK